MSEFDRIVSIMIGWQLYKRGMKKLEAREQRAGSMPVHNLDPVVNNKLEQAGRSVRKAWQTFLKRARE